MKVEKQQLDRAIKEIAKTFKILKDRVKSGQISPDNITAMTINTDDTKDSVRLEFYIKCR